MKKALTSFLFAGLAISSAAFADTATQTVPLAKVQAATGATKAQTVVNNNSTTVISPRTGISYTLGDTNGRPIILKTAAISAVTPATANRIVATNPALSTSSQEKAKQALLNGTDLALTTNQN